MKKSGLLLFLLLPLLIACEKDGIDEIKESAINFENPEVGQKSIFKRYQSICGADATFSYTDDRLILEVVKDDDGHLQFKEQFTPESPLFDSQPNPVYYTIEQRTDGLFIPNRFNSALFFFYDNDILPIHEESLTKLDQSSCRLMLGNDPFIGIEIGEVKSWDFGDYSLRNKIAVSCVPGSFWNLEGYLIFDKNQLHASHTITGDSVSGWVLE